MCFCDDELMCRRVTQTHTRERGEKRERKKGKHKKEKKRQETLKGERELYERDFCLFFLCSLWPRGSQIEEESLAKDDGEEHSDLDAAMR